MTPVIDNVAFFGRLADRMNAHPERFSALGEADMVVAVVIVRPGRPLRVRLTFAGVNCTEVAETDAAGAAAADYRLEGTLRSWTEMFDDIERHGHATGLFTINSLVLMGDRITCRGDDPMGLDKFSRFNQTLQEFLDGAAQASASAA